MKDSKGGTIEPPSLIACLLATVILVAVAIYALLVVYPEQNNGQSPPWYIFCSVISPVAIFILPLWWMRHALRRPSRPPREDEE